MVLKSLEMPLLNFAWLFYNQTVFQKFKHGIGKEV